MNKIKVDSEATIRPVIESLEGLFSKLNERFFSNDLERPVITVSPDTTSGAYGWCTSWKAWGSSEDKEKGYYEINICSEYLTRSFEEIAETLLHEMVHLQNIKDGIQDTSRSGKYHNRKYKQTAEAHGLQVDQDETYGWCKTKLNGEGKAFIDSLKNKSFSIHRIALPKGMKAAKQSSRKYVCPCCGAIVRATKPVNIMCMDCEIQMEESED